jgi:hypothetical protein
VSFFLGFRGVAQLLFVSGDDFPFMIATFMGMSTTDYSYVGAGINDRLPKPGYNALVQI